MKGLRRYLDTGSLLVAAITLALFLAALAVKGFTHEVLLEAGVFLVSVKLLIMVYHDGVLAEDIKSRLDDIAARLDREGR